jgi:O-methyltransferase
VEGGLVAAWSKVLRRVKRTVSRLRRAKAERPVAAAPDQSETPAKSAEPAPKKKKKASPPPVHPVVTEVRRQKITYLPVGALNDLYEAAVEADEQNRPGILLEAGCALGGSAIVLARAKARSRPLHVHDVFGMIPPPTDEDGTDIHERYEKITSGKAVGIGGSTYYGYEDDLVVKVKDNFAAFDLPVDANNVTLVQGLFQDTIVGEEPVAVAHIDGDWYQSVRTCLTQIGPRLPSGGVMVIDDYFYWSGCRRAVDEFLAEHPGEYQTTRRTRLQIVKS